VATINVFLTVGLSPDHEPTVSKALTVATQLPATKHNANPLEGQSPDGDSRESAIALLQVGRFSSKCRAWRYTRRLLNPWRQGRSYSLEPRPGDLNVVGHLSGFATVNDKVECLGFVVQLPSMQLWEFAPQRLKQTLTKKPGEQCPPGKTKMKELSANRHSVKGGDTD
jgi:hypothetical protein